MARKLSNIVAVVLAASVLFPHSAAIAEGTSPGVFGGAFRTADIAWIRKMGKHTYMYFAGASHFTGTSQTTPITRAWADKSKCAVAKTKHIKVIACSGRARAKRIDPDRFVMDPLMDEATLRFEGNRIRWKGQDYEAPGVYPFADPSFGAFAFASFDRWARASGRVLGTEFRGSRWSDFAFMSQGAYAFVMVNSPNGRYWIDEDGIVHYRYRFEFKT